MGGVLEARWFREQAGKPEVQVRFLTHRMSGGNDVGLMKSLYTKRTTGTRLSAVERAFVEASRGVRSTGVAYTPIPFGQYKGRALCEVDRDYLKWLAESKNLWEPFRSRLFAFLGSTVFEEGSF